jgi:hypothetical protein
MNAVASTNWLTVVGLVYLGCAIGFLVKAIAGGAVDSTRASEAACRRADAMTCLPFLAGGVGLLLAAQFYSRALDAPVVLLMLLLGLALVVCAGLDGLSIEVPPGQRSMSHDGERPTVIVPSEEPERHPLHIVKG